MSITITIVRNHASVGWEIRNPDVGRIPADSSPNFEIPNYLPSSTLFNDMTITKDSTKNGGRYVIEAKGSRTYWRVVDDLTEKEVGQIVPPEDA